MTGGELVFYSIVENIKKKRVTKAFSEGCAIQPSTIGYSFFFAGKDTYFIINQKQT